MKVVIRADASLQIGTGHVMRCLTLAEALRARGAECVFVCRAHPGNRIENLHRRGFAVHTLAHDPDWQCRETMPAHAAWLGADWETDAEQTKVCAGETAIDWLIVDHYALDERWEGSLRPHCGKIMVIDDLADRGHDCDILLDQNLVADKAQRYDQLIPANCGILLGPNYALLQPQYAELHPRTPPRTGMVRCVFVYFGGADSENLTGRTISAFLSLNRPDIALDVVINSASFHAASIRDQVKGCRNITLYENMPSLGQLMLKADLAVGAGGATSWERCCLGLPSLVITLADNQKPIAAELDRLDLVQWLGHQDAVTESMIKEALGVVLKSELDGTWSSRCRELVDGKGAARLASIIFLGPQTGLKARLACLEDEEVLLCWANDPLVRQNGFTLSGITPETHRAWFYRRLRDPGNCRIYIIETEDGLPIGQVRFERAGYEWEIHFALNALARSRKIGKAMMQTGLQEFRRLSLSGLLLARVKHSNLPSRRVFESLGFASETVGEQVVYRGLL